MDYGKSGNAKPDKNIPKHSTGRGLGAEKSPDGAARHSKDEARRGLAAAAAAKKAQG